LFRYRSKLHNQHLEAMNRINTVAVEIADSNHFSSNNFSLNLQLPSTIQAFHTVK